MAFCMLTHKRAPKKFCRNYGFSNDSIGLFPSSPKAILDKQIQCRELGMRDEGVWGSQQMQLHSGLLVVGLPQLVSKFLQEISRKGISACAFTSF